MIPSIPRTSDYLVQNYADKVHVNDLINAIKSKDSPRALELIRRLEIIDPNFHWFRDKNNTSLIDLAFKNDMIEVEDVLDSYYNAKSTSSSVEKSTDSSMEDVQEIVKAILIEPKKLFSSESSSTSSLTENVIFRSSQKRNNASSVVYSSVISTSPSHNLTEHTNKDKSKRSSGSRKSAKYDRIVSPKEHYLGSIKNIFKEKKSAELLCYTYPLFVDEKTLFTHLSSLEQKHVPAIKTFLEYLLSQSFPNGLENLFLASKELLGLMVRFEIDIPLLLEYLDNKCLIPFYDIGIDRIAPFSTKFILGKDLKNLSSQDIAFIWTIRDIELIKAIKFAEIKEYFESKAIRAGSISHIGNQVIRASKWVIYTIVSEEGKSEQRILIDKFINIAQILLKSGNVHSAQQIVNAFKNSAVNKLLSSEQILERNSCFSIEKSLEIEKLKSYFPDFSQLLDTTKVEYKKYQSIKNNNQSLPCFKTISSQLLQIKKVQRIRVPYEANGSDEIAFRNFLYAVPDIDLNGVNKLSEKKRLHSSSFSA